MSRISGLCHQIDIPVPRMKHVDLMKAADGQKSYLKAYGIFPKYHPGTVESQFAQNYCRIEL